MKYKYIFNSKGDWVAFIFEDGNVFSAKDRQWIGFEQDGDIYSPKGEYMGKLKEARGGYEAYRVLHHYSASRKFKSRPPFPSRPLFPSKPGVSTISTYLPAGYKDIFDEEQASEKIEQDSGTEEIAEDGVDSQEN